MGPRTHGPRSFDAVEVGQRETDAWAAYYRHDWAAFLRASVAMVAAGFGMGRRDTLVGAWLVLRANQAWAPFPDNDPQRARDLMRRFYSSGHLRRCAGPGPRARLRARGRVVAGAPGAPARRSRDDRRPRGVARRPLCVRVCRRARSRATGGRVAGRGDGPVGPLGARRMLPLGPAPRGGASRPRRLALGAPRRRQPVEGRGAVSHPRPVPDAAAPSGTSRRRAGLAFVTGPASGPPCHLSSCRHGPGS